MGAGSAPQVGATAIATVDAERRLQCSKIHTAGHILDKAMHESGFPLVAGKGQHHPGEGNAYVEYIGKVPEEARAALVASLEQKSCQYTSEGFEVLVEELPYSELASVCGGAQFVPGFVSQTSTTRVVSVTPGLGCPCGGTHVKNISEIGEMRVTGIRVKKGITRLTYYVPGT